MKLYGMGVIEIYYNAFQWIGVITIEGKYSIPIISVILERV